MVSLISNPPYNMKWKLPPFAQLQSRFNDCELPPESNANYAFILTALDMIDGKAVFLLPCGALSSDNAQEKEIRRYLVEINYIEAVITCPDKMFEATSIPVCIIVFNKQKETAQVSMIDMRQTFEVEEREQRGQYGGASHEKRVYKKQVNVFSAEDMEKALFAISEKRNEPGFSKTVGIEDIKQNDYILTPARYIELQDVEAQHREYRDIVEDLNAVIAEKNLCKLTINESLAKTLGFDVNLYKQDQGDNELNDLIQKIAGEKIQKTNYFTASKNAGEMKFENTSKQNISSVLLMILNMWKQHIFYLNKEENRYLAELRDALLLDLMSGKIDVSAPN